MTVPIVVDNKFRRVSAAEAWLSWPDRRSYQKLDLIPPPLECPAGTFNTWRGWGIEPRQGKCDLIWQHILSVVAGGNEAAARYIWCWAASGVQHLDRKLEAAVLLTGPQGVGKGTLGNLLLRFYGSHALYLSQKEHLTGRYNAQLMDRLFVFCDEAFFANDRASSPALKSLITERQLTVEPKFMTPFQVKNRMRLLFVSNEPHALPLDRDDRRIASFEAVPVWSGEVERLEYFERLYDEIDAGGDAAFLYELLNTNLEGFDERVIPTTASRVLQKIGSLRGPERFLFEQLQSGAWWRKNPDMHDQEEPSGPSNPVTLAKTYMFLEYQKWVRETRGEYPESSVQFWLKIKKVIPTLSDYRPGGENRSRQVVLPPLENIRDAFEKSLRGEGLITWT